MNGNFFQNMAPNAQRSLLTTLGLGAVATVLYLFAVEPSDSSLTKERRRLAELQERQMRMNTDLRGADNVKKTLAELEAALKPYRDAILTPSFDYSYAMRAKSLVEPLAQGAGLTELDYAGEPFFALPVTKPMAKQLYTRAAVKLSAKGSYQSAISFLLRLEQEMPLTSVRSLHITAQNDPAKQQIEIVLEWPALGKTTRK